MNEDEYCIVHGCDICLSVVRMVFNKRASHKMSIVDVLFRLVGETVVNRRSKPDTEN